MSAFQAIFRQLIALFVDDGSLALAILGFVALAAALATVAPEFRGMAGAVLLFGCLGVLIANVSHSSERH
jgi:lipopolysaccharide export LptBFGC system permease protein LptF